MSPLLGQNYVTLKAVLLIALPPFVVTLILPVVAPLGTLSFNLLDDTNVTAEARTPLNTACSPRHPHFR